MPEAERLLAEGSGRETLETVLQEMTAEFREAIVLRSVPVGTAMSRLARARAFSDLPGAAGTKGGVKCTAKKPGV